MNLTARLPHAAAAEVSGQSWSIAHSQEITILHLQINKGIPDSRMPAIVTPDLIVQFSFYLLFR